jgi:predicted Na+-dependent transporter
MQLSRADVVHCLSDLSMTTLAARILTPADVQLLASICPDEAEAKTFTAFASTGGDVSKLSEASPMILVSMTHCRP